MLPELELGFASGFAIKLEFKSWISSSLSLRSFKLSCLALADRRLLDLDGVMLKLDVAGVKADVD